MTRNVSSLVVYSPDFYGPHARNTVLYETLKNVIQHKTVNFVGNTHVKREFLYTFDGAKAMIDLALRDSTCNKNSNISTFYEKTRGDNVLNRSSYYFKR